MGVLRVVLEVKEDKVDEDSPALLARLRMEKRCSRSFYTTLLDLSRVSIHIFKQVPSYSSKRGKQEGERTTSVCTATALLVLHNAPLFSPLLYWNQNSSSKI